MIPGILCYKPVYHERLSLMLESESYVLDNELVIQSSSSYAHRAYTTAYSSLYQSGIQSTITDLEKLQTTQLTLKGEGNRISEASKTHKNRVPFC